MQREDKDGFITLDETVSDSLTCVNDSMNDSKRKADDSDSDCVIESDHARKRLCQEVEMEVESKPTDSQIITVTFQSQDIARKYSKEITDYIAQLTKSEITTSVERDGKSCLEFYKDQDSGKSDDPQIIGTLQTNPADALPQYDQTFSGVIGVECEAKVQREAKPKNMCFNCEGDHMIAACPEPRDASRISKNRRAHADRNPIYNRYHEETEQKFGHLTPGRVSDGLREALGLRSADLPLHTYRMRVQGYPPGWLRSARLQRSNISVHHEPTLESDKDDSKANEKEEDNYDLTKLISFPGFNIDNPDGCRDDHKRKGFPALQSYWSLPTMKSRLKRAPAARRTGQQQRPLDLPSSATKEAAAGTAATGSNGDAPVTVETSTNPTSNGDEDGSPSLEILEEQRRALLDSLDEPAEPAEDGEEEGEVEEEEEVTEQLVHAPPAASSTPQTPVLTPGASRRRELGTPVSAGSAHVAYDAGKWSAGITEHIPYENLPGATGAWDRMSSLMKKVRDQLSGDK